MASSIFQTPTDIPAQNRLSQLSNTISLLKSSPSQLTQNLLAQHPKYQEVMTLVSQSGGNAKAAFYKLAKEKGVDPDSVLRLLR